MKYRFSDVKYGLVISYDLYIPLQIHTLHEKSLIIQIRTTNRKINTLNIKYRFSDVKCDLVIYIFHYHQSRY